MRAALLESWPALTLYFGIRPDDMPRYSVPELIQYVQAAKRLAEEARR